MQYKCVVYFQNLKQYMMLFGPSISTCTVYNMVVLHISYALLNTCIVDGISVLYVFRILKRHMTPLGPGIRAVVSE